MIKIATMNSTDIAEAIKLWEAQFNRYCRCNAFPDFLIGGKETLENYLFRQIGEKNAIVAIKDNNVVGYMAWMYFDFHNEPSAFLPTVGNAAVVENENAIFRELYMAASQKWVRDNRFNHLWMTYYDDTALKDMLYDIGFGSYVIDACQRTDSHTLATTSNWKVTKATSADIDAVLELENASERNLSSPPIFLVRNAWQRDDVIKLFNEDEVFVAWDDNRIIGILNFKINQRYHFERLTTLESAGGLGAYIVPEYRGRGVGTRLLQEAFDFCHNAGKPFLHVSFESANPDGIKFWPKYFKPVIRSVRRAVNKDANTIV